MKSLKNISAFRLSILISISLYVNSIYLYVIFCLYLFIKNIKELIIYIFIVLICLYIPKIDFIPIGIVDEIKSDYVIVNKVLYKVKLYSNNLQVGDIVKCDNFNINTYTDIKKNILFYGNDYEFISYIRIKRYLYNHLNIYKAETKSIFLQLFYNIYTYDDIDINIGYGLPIYYLFQYIQKKNKYICIILLVLYSLLFNYQTKFFLLIIDIIFYKFKSKERFTCKLFFICFINIKLFNNFSILLPLLISLYSFFKIDIDFRIYLGIIESILFCDFNMISLLMYKPFIIMRIMYFLFSILLLFFPNLEIIFLKLTNYYSLFNNISIFNIRGQISFVSLIVLLYLFKIIDNDIFNLKYGLFILLLISPFNDIYASVNFIDVGQGDSILIKDVLNNGSILIDTGSNYNYYKLKKFLLKKGIYKIDYLIISHNDNDHCGNIENIQKDFKIDNIIQEPGDVKLNDIILHNYYLGEFDNDNDNSLIYSLNINNKAFMFTGDISSEVERMLVNNKGPFSIDILKASHHGSDSGNSDYFVANILPEYVIYSTSGQYNHPSTHTIKTMDKYQVKQYSTKDCGDIYFVFTKLFSFIKTNNGGGII